MDKSKTLASSFGSSKKPSGNCSAKLVIDWTLFAEIACSATESVERSA